MMEKSLLKKLQWALLSIPAGRVVSYKELSRYLGMPKSYRVVGGLCGKNPEPDVFPCYKVVRSDGGLGGYSVDGGVEEKARRLREDGILVRGGRIVDLEKRLYVFIT
jgi:O-6-methylguanine DNA methyltransferase